MRLLLDEMYPPAIAEQLRRRGHDAEAVAARPELRTLPDDDLFETAQAERRVVVTENIPDFSAIADRRDERGRSHHGLILVDPGKYPRGDGRTIRRMVTALNRLLNENPEEKPVSLRLWL